MGEHAADCFDRVFGDVDSFQEDLVFADPSFDGGRAGFADGSAAVSVDLHGGLPKPLLKFFRQVDLCSHRHIGL